MSRIAVEMSDFKTKIEALLKLGDEGAILRSLEDAERRRAEAHTNSVKDKSSKNSTTPQKNPEPDDEQKDCDGHNADGSQDPRLRGRSMQTEELCLRSKGDKTKSNQTSVYSKRSSVRRNLDLQLNALKE